MPETRQLRQRAPAPDARDLRSALGHFATGVTIVTAKSPEGRRAGLTVNSFSSVSLAPPLVLWSLSERAPSRDVFMRASHFAVHVLGGHQRHLSERFSSPLPDKFADLDPAEGLGGAPLIAEASATFECRRRYDYHGGDHVIFVGEIERYSYSSRAPLIFYRGRYTTLPPRDA